MSISYENLLFSSQSSKAAFSTIKQSSTVRPLSALCLYSLGFFFYSLNKITSQVSQAHLEPVWLICFYTFTEAARGARGARPAVHPIDPIGHTEIHDIKLRQPFPAEAANHVFEVALIALAPRGFSL